MSHIVQVNPAPSAAVPRRGSFARRVHQNAAHHLCADRKEMRLAFQSHVLNVDQFQVDLMHQGRRLQDGLFALPIHEIYGQAVKFLVNARRERIERSRIAAGPCEQKLRRIGDLIVRSHGVFRI